MVGVRSRPKGESAAVERRVEAAAEAEGRPAVMRSAAAGALFGGGGSSGSRLPTSSRVPRVVDAEAGENSAEDGCRNGERVADGVGDAA